MSRWGCGPYLRIMINATLTMHRNVTKKSKFWDRIAERYAKQPVADEVSYQRKLEVTRSYLRPEMTVLEFGCGTGSTALVHAPHVRQIHAIDISAKMIEIAKRKAKAAQVENVTFTQGTLEDFAVERGRYDAILGMSIIHLLDDIDGTLGMVHDMLKPGGVFVSSTPCLGDTQRWFKLVGPIGAFFRLIPRVVVLGTDELDAKVRAAGFTIEHRWQPGPGKAMFLVAKKA